MIDQPSIFADLVDRLRFKSEAELKQLYLQFFNKELKDEWKDILKEADFNVSEEEIVEVIQKHRYNNNV